MSSLFRTVFLFVVSALLLGGCAKKGDPAEATKQFFALLAAGQSEQAFNEAAFGFRIQQSEKAFAQTVQEMGLTNQDSIEWQAPEILGHEATVRLTSTTKDGRKLSFIVTLVDESGAWRVHSLRSPKPMAGSRTENRFTLVGKGAAFSDAQSQRQPDEKEINEMILRTLQKFDDAIQQKSFTDFYDDVAVAWQKQLTVGQLERAFRPFIDAGVRFGGLTEAEMQLDGPPAINTEGVLVINGHFHTAPYQVYFSMKFIYELPHWKLFGLDVNLQR
jgi:hypothetical protein